MKFSSLRIVVMCNSDYLIRSWQCAVLDVCLLLLLVQVNCCCTGLNDCYFLGTLLMGRGEGCVGPVADTARAYPNFSNMNRQSINSTSTWMGC